MMDNLTLSWEILVPVAVVMIALLVIRLLPRLMGGGVPFVEPLQVESWRAGGDDMLIIDVRNPDEFSGGHIPDALNMPLLELQARLLHLRASGALDELKNTPVYVICATDARAAAGARMFKKAGFQRLAVIAGGFSRWRREGLPASV